MSVYDSQRALVARAEAQYAALDELYRRLLAETRDKDDRIRVLESEVARLSARLYGI